MSPLELAQLCSDIYSITENFVIYDCDGVYVGLRRVGDIDLFVFRGSATVEDWMHDIDLLVVNHPQLGWCHEGMLTGIDKAFEWVKSQIREGCKASFTGHSLGGAHARFMAGLFIANNLQTDILMTFGSPKPSFKELKVLISSSTINHSSYRHLKDIVPELPPEILGFMHTEDWIELGGDSASVLEDFSDHLIQYYIGSLSLQAALD